MIKNILLVVLGGGIGSGARYLFGHFLSGHKNLFPAIGTFTVNILGSFLLGILIATLLKNTEPRSGWSLLLITGFCGGFTTFSTFAFENYSLIKTGDYTTFLLYTFGSLLLGITAVALGILIGIKF